MFSLHIPWYFLYGCYQPVTSFRWESSIFALITLWLGSESVLVGDVCVSVNRNSLHCKSHVCIFARRLCTLLTCTVSLMLCYSGCAVGVGRYSQVLLRW